MVEQDSGDILWKTQVDENTNIQSELFVTDGQKIYATHVQDVRAFDITSGEIVWVRDLPGEGGGFLITEIIYSNGRIFAC